MEGQENIKKKKKCHVITMTENVQKGNLYS